MDLKVKFVLHSLRKLIKTVKSIIKGKLLTVTHGRYERVYLLHETYLCVTFKIVGKDDCFYSLSVVLLDTLELDGVPCLSCATGN